MTCLLLKATELVKSCFAQMAVPEPKASRRRLRRPALVQGSFSQYHKESFMILN